MGNKKSYLRKRLKTLPLAVQAAGLKRVFPDSDVTFNKHIVLTWVGQLKPSPLSEKYTVKIKYRLKQRPVVSVVSPEIVSRNGSRIPHVFSAKELCLFRYKYNEWDSTMPIARTIVPWTSLWLLHYEIWLATGKWCGSNQEHPMDNKDKGYND